MRVDVNFRRLKVKIKGGAIDRDNGALDLKLNVNDIKQR